MIKYTLVYQIQVLGQLNYFPPTTGLKRHAYFSNYFLKGMAAVLHFYQKKFLLKYLDQHSALCISNRLAVCQEASLVIFILGVIWGFRAL